MSQRKSGFRKKTRDKVSKSIREKSKFRVNRYLAAYHEGERVLLKLEPSFHRGMFLPRFYGKTGVVGEKRGSCYLVHMKDGHKEKTLIVHSAHLRRL